MTPGLVKLRERYGIDTQYNPCINDWTPIYMNRPDVLKVRGMVSPSAACDY
jgi:hypothetical protein